MSVLSPWPIDSEDPESSIPDASEFKDKPLEYGYLLMDLSAEADRAFEAGKYDRAMKFYRALAKAAPVRSAAYTRICDTYEAMGKLPEAMVACKAALAREGVRAIDYARYVELLLKVKTQLNDEDVADVRAVFDHVDKANVDFLPITYAKCDVGVRLKDEGLLENCTKTLARKAPNDGRTVTYEWTLAMLRRDREAAQILVAKAPSTDMKPEGVETMRVATAQLFDQYAAERRQTAVHYGVVAAAAAGVAGAGYAVSRMLRQRRRTA